MLVTPDSITFEGLEVNGTTVRTAEFTINDVLHALESDAVASGGSDPYPV